MTFEQLIKAKYEDLSPGQKKVAQFLLERMENAVFLTAVQIGKEADVSETTVIRLSYALGFSGFSEMQASIQKQVLSASGANQLHRESSAEEEEAGSLFVKAIERDISILRQLQAKLNQSENDIWTAVNWLIEADQVLVVGYRGSYGPAHWLSTILSQYRDNIQLSSFNGDIHEKIVNLTEESVAFVISYPRYSKEALRIAESVKQQGAKIIAATDRPLSPVGRLADLCFTTEENNVSGSNSFAGGMSLLNLILMGIVMKDQVRVQRRSQRLEQLYANDEVFVE